MASRLEWFEFRYHALRPPKAPCGSAFSIEGTPVVPRQRVEIIVVQSFVNTSVPLLASGEWSSLGLGTLSIGIIIARGSGEEISLEAAVSSATSPMLPCGSKYRSANIIQ